MLSNAELILRLCLAALLGSMIGLERERKLWAAGLRTHMLVCVGSCLIMIISAYSFFDILENHQISLDPSRIAAQVVSGIGFLGAGAILLRGDVVRGLTTAASLWAVAGIGLAVGGGLYLAAGVTTVIILIILSGIKPLEEKLKIKKMQYILVFQSKSGEMTWAVLKNMLGDKTHFIQHFRVQPDTLSSYDNVTVVLAKIPKYVAINVADQIKMLPYVKNLEITTSFSKAVL